MKSFTVKRFFLSLMVIQMWIGQKAVRCQEAGNTTIAINSTLPCRYKVWYLDICDAKAKVQRVHLILADGGLNCEVSKHVTKECQPSQENDHPIMPKNAIFKGLLLSNNHTIEALETFLNKTDNSNLPLILQPNSTQRQIAESILVEEMKDFERQEDKTLSIHEPHEPLLEEVTKTKKTETLEELMKKEGLDQPNLKENFEETKLGKILEKASVSLSKNESVESLTNVSKPKIEINKEQTTLTNETITAEASPTITTQKKEHETEEVGATIKPTGEVKLTLESDQERNLLKNVDPRIKEIMERIQNETEHNKTEEAKTLDLNTIMSGRKIIPEKENPKTDRKDVSEKIVTEVKENSHKIITTNFKTVKDEPPTKDSTANDLLRKLQMDSFSKLSFRKQKENPFFDRLDVLKTDKNNRLSGILRDFNLDALQGSDVTKMKDDSKDVKEMKVIFKPIDGKTSETESYHRIPKTFGKQKSFDESVVVREISKPTKRLRPRMMMELQDENMIKKNESHPEIKSEVIPTKMNQSNLFTKSPPEIKSEVIPTKMNQSNLFPNHLNLDTSNTVGEKPMEKDSEEKEGTNDKTKEARKSGSKEHEDHLKSQSEEVGNKRTQLPDFMPKGSNDRLNDIIPKGLNDRLKDIMSKDSNDQLNDIMPKGLNDRLKHIMSKDSNDQLNDIMPKGSNDRLKDIMSKGSNDRLNDIMSKGSNDRLNDIMSKGSNDQKPPEESLIRNQFHSDLLHDFLKDTSKSSDNSEHPKSNKLRDLSPFNLKSETKPFQDNQIHEPIQTAKKVDIETMHDNLNPSVFFKNLERPKKNGNDDIKEFLKTIEKPRNHPGDDERGSFYFHKNLDPPKNDFRKSRENFSPDFLKIMEQHRSGGDAKIDFHSNNDRDRSQEHTKDKIFKNTEKKEKEPPKTQNNFDENDSSFKITKEENVMDRHGMDLTDVRQLHTPDGSKERTSFIHPNRRHLPFPELEPRPKTQPNLMRENKLLSKGNDHLMMQLGNHKPFIPPIPMGVESDRILGQEDLSQNNSVSEAELALMKYIATANPQIPGDDLEKIQNVLLRANSSLIPEKDRRAMLEVVKEIENNINEKRRQNESGLKVEATIKPVNIPSNFKKENLKSEQKEAIGRAAFQEISSGKDTNTIVKSSELVTISDHELENQKLNIMSTSVDIPTKKPVVLSLPISGNQQDLPRGESERISSIFTDDLEAKSQEKELRQLLDNVRLMRSGIPNNSAFDSRSELRRVSPLKQMLLESLQDNEPQKFDPVKDDYLKPKRYVGYPSPNLSRAVDYPPSWNSTMLNTSRIINWYIENMPKGKQTIIVL